MWKIPHFWKFGRYSSMWMMKKLRWLQFSRIGSLEAPDGNCNIDIRSLIGIGQEKKLDLVPVWWDRGTNISILRSLVWTVLIYGAEGWTGIGPCRKLMRKISKQQNCGSRGVPSDNRILRISWTEHRTDQNILTERTQPDSSDLFCAVRFRFRFRINCLFDIICQVIEQHTLCIINVRRLPLRQLVVADMGAT